MMNLKYKLSVTSVLFSLFYFGYSDPEVSTQWSNSLPGSNQTIEQVQAEMNESVKKESISDNAEEVFAKEQNLNTTLPVDPKLSDEALNYLTFCNEQLPDMLKNKYGATMLSSSNVKSEMKGNSITLKYMIDAIKGNGNQTFNVKCVVKNNKAKLSLKRKN